MLSRRALLQEMLRHAPLVALAPAVPNFLASTARAAPAGADGRVLVVIQLDGGNDGTNTVVPFKDEGYARHRQKLHLPATSLIKVGDEVGLHPALKDFGQLLEDGRLAIVQGVGFPNPNRSHFEAMAIWHSARQDPEGRNGLGWIGRALDIDPKPTSGVPASLFVGPGAVPPALRGRRSVASALSRPDDFLLPERSNLGLATPRPGQADDALAYIRRSTLDGYATAERVAAAVQVKEGAAAYPATQLAGQLRLVARLLKADLGTRVYYTMQPGYDTHSGQAAAHSELLGELSGALRAFLDDLAATRIAERVVVLCFSEFGRTLRENGSMGTDHGTAGPVFLAGPGVKAGLIGKTPNLTDLSDGDLKITTDFREIYTTLLEEWLKLPAEAAVGEEFGHLPLLRT